MEGPYVDASDLSAAEDLTHAPQQRSIDAHKSFLVKLICFIENTMHLNDKILAQRQMDHVEQRHLIFVRVQFFNHRAELIGYIKFIRVKHQQNEV
jgi:hypothetical protein